MIPSLEKNVCRREHGRNPVQASSRSPSSSCTVFFFVRVLNPQIRYPKTLKQAGMGL